MCGSKYIYGCAICKSEFKTENRTMDGLNCPNCKGYLDPLKIESDIHDENIVTYAKYECFSCRHCDSVKGKRKDYKEVMPCPKCSGFYVDMWHQSKYKTLKDNVDNHNRILVTYGEHQFATLQDVIVTYKNGRVVKYKTQDVRKLYLNVDAVVSIYEEAIDLRD